MNELWQHLTIEVSTAGPGAAPECVRSVCSVCRVLFRVYKNSINSRGAAIEKWFQSAAYWTLQQCQFVVFFFSYSWMKVSAVQRSRHNDQNNWTCAHLQWSAVAFVCSLLSIHIYGIQIECPLCRAGQVRVRTQSVGFIFPKGHECLVFLGYLFGQQFN